MRCVGTHVHTPMPRFDARLRRDRATSSMASGTGMASTRMRMAAGSRASGSTTRCTAGASRSTRAATAMRASGSTVRSTDRCALAACVCTLRRCWLSGAVCGASQGTLWYAGGDRYQGEWKDGKMHGRGTYTYAEGDRQACPAAQGGGSNSRIAPDRAMPHDLPCCGGSLRRPRRILDRAPPMPRPRTPSQVRGRLEGRPAAWQGHGHLRRARRWRGGEVRGRLERR